MMMMMMRIIMMMMMGGTMHLCLCIYIIFNVKW